MTERQNIIRAYRGEVPEWIPNYDVACQYLSPEALQDPNYKLYALYEQYAAKGEEKNVTMKDAFGVTWLLDEYGPITDPNHILLEDINEWKEKFTIPVLDGYDWDAACKRDAALLVPDKMVQISFIGVFMNLVNAMGFENALMAMALEEDETMDFFDAVCSFHEEVIRNVLPRIHCDSIQIGDDMANTKSLFMSPDMYRKMIKPFHARLINMAREMEPEILVEFHCCGHCEDIIDDFVEIGVQVWQPAQPMNDIRAIRKKYGNRLSINGIWDAVGLTGNLNTTEGDIRKSVRDIFDEYGPDGGYIFWNGGPVGRNPEISKRLNWAFDEANRYGKIFYKK